MKVKYYPWKKRVVPYNTAFGIQLEYFNTFSERIRKKLSTKTIFVGEAGIGKTYFAIDFAMMFDPKFTIDQVIFTHEDYLDLTLKLPTGRGIVLDEPSYVISHREWYNDLNRILVRSIEADRYKVHPLYLPIINQSLLDKTVREHLIQFMFFIYDRGKARVYRVSHGQFQDKTFYNYLTDIYSIQPKLDLETCGRTTCLGCKQLSICDKFIWPQYERKRNETQTERWENGKAEILQKQKKRKSFSSRINEALEHETELKDQENKWDITKIMMYFEVSEPYAYRIAKGARLKREREENRRKS